MKYKENEFKCLFCFELSEITLYCHNIKCMIVKLQSKQKKILFSTDHQINCLSWLCWGLVIFAFFPLKMSAFQRTVVLGMQWLTCICFCGCDV